MSKGISTEFIDLVVDEWVTLPSNAVNIVFESAGAAEIKTAHTTSSTIHDVGTVANNKLVVTDSMFLMQNVKTNVAAARVYFGRSK